MKQFWMAAIALGLWANAAALWLKPAHAQGDDLLFLSSIDRNIQDLIQGGARCTNRKLCD